LEPGGLWDSDEVEIRAWVTKDGERVADVELTYAGEPSQFEAILADMMPGTYHVTAFAFDPHNGNAGVDYTTFIVR
jgi:hypothetical protein